MMEEAAERHNEEILREIQNRIMKEIWSIILTSLAESHNLHPIIMSGK